LRKAAGKEEIGKAEEHEERKGGEGRF